METSLVRGAIRTARRTVLMSFVATTMIVGSLTWERFEFEHAFQTAAAKRRDAMHVSGRIMLEDERLTMSANMAVASGDERWIRRYEDHIRLMDEAIDAGIALATPAIARRFENETKLANDILVELERKSFEAVRRGNFAGAHAILDGPLYQEYKRNLEEGTTRFTDELRDAASAGVQQVREHANLHLLLVNIIGLLGFIWLWRRLSSTLGASEAGFIHAEQRLMLMAMNDELTGLPNRRTFIETVDALLLESTTNGGRLVGIAMLDIDHFKDVNDTLGHQAGDELIRAITRRLHDHLPENAVLARFGGDELAIAIPGLDSASAAKHMDDVIAAFEIPFVFEGQSLFITASAGVSHAPLHGIDAATLLRLADIALYRAKAEGRGRVKLFDPEMDATMRERIAIEADLRMAVVNNEMSLNYQPLMSPDGTVITGLEALIRWRHPQRGMISPGVFIPVAEHCGLIIQLGDWVLKRAFTDAARWPHLMLAINLSPQQFRHPDFVATIRRLVAESGVEPGRIELEVTESLLLEESDRVRKALSALRDMGFRISLDDFGTGYSSLSYLRKFPFNKIKIDQSFIKSIETSNEAAQIIHSMVSLGRALKMTVTAEGVETAEQHRFLRSAGCQQLQGYLFARPVTAEAIDDLVAGMNGASVAKVA